MQGNQCQSLSFFVIFLFSLKFALYFIISLRGLTSGFSFYHVAVKSSNLLSVPPELRHHLSSLRGGTEMPGEADLNGVAFALVRLQDTYNLTVDDLVQGNILGRKAVDVLSGEYDSSESRCYVVKAFATQELLNCN